jgi:hypothetical protein
MHTQNLFLIQSQIFRDSRIQSLFRILDGYDNSIFCLQSSKKKHERSAKEQIFKPQKLL